MQHFIINSKGRESEKIYTYKYIYNSLCCTSETNIVLYITTLQFLKEKNHIMHSKVKYEIFHIVEIL